MDHIRSNPDCRVPTALGVWMSAPVRPALVCVVMCGLPLYASSAETSTGNPSVVAPDPTLQEIVVTAEKRNETALRTPVALSAYSGENLQENQIISVSDLQNLDPSVNVSRAARGNVLFIAIRGVTTSDTTSASSPGIAFNVDGIPLNRGVEQSAAFFDLERVEVLKGPQGTLYGQSSTGGALNIITNKPKNELQASAEVTVGDYNTRRTTAMVNLPLTGGIALRAAVNSNKHDGYLIPVDGSAPLNDQDNFTSRVSLLDNFSDDMSLLLTQTNGNVGGAGSGYANWDTLNSAPTGVRQRIIYGNPFPNRLDDTFSNFNAQFNWAIGPLHLAYLGGYFNYSGHDLSSSANNPLANGDGTTTTYQWTDNLIHVRTNSHELRLSNQAPGFADWVAGVNWYREHIRNDIHQWSADQTTPDTVPTVAGSQPLFDFLSDATQEAKGAFGQTTLHLSEQWDATLGMRYTSDSLDRPGATTVGSGRPRAVRPSEKDHKLTYRVGGDYHFTDTQMLFADVATGFKPGGYNAASRTTAQTTYKPEELTAFEVGYKGRPAGNLEIDSDLFYYDYSAHQVSGVIALGTPPVNVIQTSISPAVIYGWENELTYKPTHADEFRLSVTFLKSRYKDVVEPLHGVVSDPVSFNGKSLDDTPSVAMILGYAREWTLAAGGTFRAHAELKYSSSYVKADLSDAVQYRQPSFTRSNVDIRYTDASGKLYLGAFVLNVENKLQITSNPIDFFPGPDSSNSSIPNAAVVTVTDPRTWGFTVGVKF
jgi:iron complex outermembrane receptor protein